MRKKLDLFGILVPLGVGVITGMVYIVGKLTGRSEAYNDCANMLQEAITEAQEANDE